MRTFARKLKAAQQTTSAKATIPGRAHFGQSPEVNSILHLRRTIGNQAVQRMLQTHAEELEVGLTGQSGQEHERLQPKRFQRGNLGQSAVPPVVHEVLASPGQPLDPATLAFMEPRFGHDFGGVRVHADTKAAESAELVNALAYTVGRHVVLGEGQPEPATTAGRQLLAHELAHVVQQSRGGSAPGATSSAPHEQDARAAAIAVAAGSPRVNIACGTGVGVARQDAHDVVAVGRDLLEELEQVRITELTEEGLGRIADIEDRLRRVAQGGGEHAGTAQRLLGQIDDLMDAQARNAQLQVKLAEAHGFLRRHGRIPPGPRRTRSADWIRTRLRELAGTEGAEASARRARQLSNQIERLGARHRELEAARRAAAQMFQAPGNVEQKVKTAPKVEPKVPAQSSVGVKTVPGGGTPSTTAGAKAAQTGAKVEEAVQTGAKRLTTVAGKGGSMAKAVATRAIGALSIVDPLLLPGPLDAISLMADVAKGYTAAWDIIKRENTQSGFAAGLASSLLRLSPDEVRAKLERRSAASGTRARFAGAVGLAESSFNRALGEGYRFGNHLPREGRNALRELSGLLARDKSSATIWAMAKALLPTVDRIFEEARKKEEAARERQELLEREPHGGKL